MGSFNDKIEFCQGDYPSDYHIWIKFPIKFPEFSKMPPPGVCALLLLKNPRNLIFVTVKNNISLKVPVTLQVVFVGSDRQ